jgi:RNA polymerase sigma-70 factor (ECF subfamily)
MGDQDHELVRQAARGDRAAQSMLWREHRSFVAVVLLGQKAPGVELEDLLQDVAVTFVRAIHRLADPASLRAWLRVVAINAARSAARRSTSPVRRTASLDGEPVDPSPDRQQNEQEVRRRLDLALAAVERLQPLYREPLLLKSVHGLSQKEIAALLGVPVTAIESRLARARRMVRAALARAGDECSRVAMRMQDGRDYT